MMRAGRDHRALFGRGHGAATLGVIAALLHVLGCGGTGFDKKWVDVTTIQTMQRIVVLAAAPDTMTRNEFEDTFARRLQLRGNDAHAGHDIIPSNLRGKIPEIRQRLTDKQFDGVLVTRIASADEVLTTLGAVDLEETLTPLPPAPPGTVKARLRTSLYRVGDSRLLWDAITTTKGSSLREGVAAFSKTVASELGDLGLVR